MSSNAPGDVVASYEDLMDLTVRIYEAAGTPTAHAEIVARHQVGSNLVGYDSHGLQLLPSYVERIGKGHVMPAARPVVLSESSASLYVDGKWGFGQVITEWVVQRAIEKVAESGIVIASVRDQGHVGRLGAYPLMAAARGYVAIMMCDSGQAPKQVAPFGGREARLGTNPLCIALPSDLDAPVYLDMATSSVAMAKLKVYRARGQSVPSGWILDKEGQPSTDPNDYFDGGVLLPLGGNEGYKGYGLSLMVETLAAILPGLGYGVDPQGRHNDGMFFMVFDPAMFRPLADFKADIEGFVEFLKATSPAAGFSEVLYPGELERRTEVARRRDGIPIDLATWNEVTAVAERLGVSTTIGSDTGQPS